MRCATFNDGGAAAADIASALASGGNTVILAQLQGVTGVATLAANDFTFG